MNCRCMAVLPINSPSIPGANIFLTDIHFSDPPSVALRYSRSTLSHIIQLTKNECEITLSGRINTDALLLAIGLFLCFLVISCFFGVNILQHILYFFLYSLRFDPIEFSFFISFAVFDINIWFGWRLEHFRSRSISIENFRNPYKKINSRTYISLRAMAIDLYREWCCRSEIVIYRLG